MMAYTGRINNSFPYYTNPSSDNAMTQLFENLGQNRDRKRSSKKALNN